jgi:hypothetical protein
LLLRILEAGGRGVGRILGGSWVGGLEKRGNAPRAKDSQIEM